MHERKRRDPGAQPLPPAVLPAPAQSAVASRRRFLFALGASGAAAASAATLAVTPGSAPAAGATAASEGYRETAHVRNYYASARH